MHEVSLVAELVEACERLADGAPVRRVRVRHASSLPADAVRQAFALLTEGGTLAGADLELASFEADVHCPCGSVVRTGHDGDGFEPFVICPSCDGLVSRPGTPELELIAVAT